MTCKKREKQRDVERAEDRFFQTQFIPQVAVTVRAGSGQSQEAEMLSGSMCIIISTLESSSSASVTHLQ